MYDAIDKDTPEEKMLRQEHDGILARAIRTLPLSQRIVLELLVYQGCSYQEIAHRTGDPVNTVKTRMFRARCGLADRIAALERGSLPSSPPPKRFSRKRMATERRPLAPACL
jgi:DNA-directed RNA polymerase specialized sigma24 family protein